MVDLPMMYKLLSALPEHASLILPAIRINFASVEAGAVLADICAGLKCQLNPITLLRTTQHQTTLLCGKCAIQGTSRAPGVR